MQVKCSTRDCGSLKGHFPAGISDNDKLPADLIQSRRQADFILSILSESSTLRLQTNSIQLTNHDHHPYVVECILSVQRIRSQAWAAEYTRLCAMFACFYQ